MRKKMTPEKLKELRKLLGTGKTVSEAASLLDLTEDIVYRWIHKDPSLKPRGKPKITALQERLIADLIRKGYSAKEISNALGLKYSVLSYYLWRNKMKPRMRFRTKGIQDRNFIPLKETIVSEARAMSQQQLEDLRAIILYQLRRYTAKNYVKYGNIPRGFSDEEASLFFSSIDEDICPGTSEKYKLLFLCQAMMGLRVGEACVIKVSDINHQTRELTLETEKNHRLDRILIPSSLYGSLASFIMKHQTEIGNNQGYVFYAEKAAHSKNPYLQPAQARKVFRRICTHAKLKESYGTSDEVSASHSIRPLYRLTTHSLRHFAITRYYNFTRDVAATNLFARHTRTNLKTTMSYISSGRDALYQNIESVFKDTFPIKEVEMRPRTNH
jgi:integrase